MDDALDYIFLHLGMPQSSVGLMFVANVVVATLHHNDVFDHTLCLFDASIRCPGIDQIPPSRFPERKVRLTCPCPLVCALSVDRDGNSFNLHVFTDTRLGTPSTHNGGVLHSCSDHIALLLRKTSAPFETRSNPRGGRQVAAFRSYHLCLGG